MKLIITIILFFNCCLLYSQEDGHIPIRLFKGEQIFDGPFKVDFINADTVIEKNIQIVEPFELHNYSIRICFNKHRLLIPRRNDQIHSFNIYLNRKTYRKKLGESSFGVGNLFKKYYYVDLGLDVVFRISRSDKKHCERTHAF